MTLGWIVLGVMGWGLGLVVVLTLFRMAGDQDRAARHEQKRLDPVLGRDDHALRRHG
jgi:hypothetical protein